MTQPDPSWHDTLGMRQRALTFWGRKSYFRYGCSSACCRHLTVHEGAPCGLVLTQADHSVCLSPDCSCAKDILAADTHTHTHHVMIVKTRGFKMSQMNSNRKRWNYSQEIFHCGNEERSSNRKTCWKVVSKLFQLHDFKSIALSGAIKIYGSK